MKRYINKEKEGYTIRFSIRLPREQHKWLKNRSKNSKDIDGKYKSMNNYISDAIDMYIENKS